MLVRIIFVFISSVNSELSSLCGHQWDHESILHAEHGQKLEFWKGDFGLVALHDGEHVSESFKKKGRWTECDALEVPFTTDGRESTGAEICGTSLPGRVFVDVGANIGLCSLQLLAKGLVDHVVAFEPVRDNLAAFTSSLLANPNYSKKAQVFSGALGAKRFTSSMANPARSADWDNNDAKTWNSGMGRLHGEEVVQNLNVTTYDVQIDTLDSLFPTGEIHLLKVDVEGFESRVLQGARQLLKEKRIRHVAVEVHRNMLPRYGAFMVDIVNHFYRSGYEVYWNGNVLPYEAIHCGGLFYIFGEKADLHVSVLLEARPSSKVEYLIQDKCCWAAAHYSKLTPSYCCNPDDGVGNSDCWQEDFTFQRCCVDEKSYADAFSEWEKGQGLTVYGHAGFGQCSHGFEC